MSNTKNNTTDLSEIKNTIFKICISNASDADKVQQIFDLVKNSDDQSPKKKKYLVTFRNKLSNNIVGEVEVEEFEEDVINTSRVLLIHALEKLKDRGVSVDNKHKWSWSFREF